MANVVSMKSLLEAGVHFGHQTRRWNPKMAPYIYTERNGIMIAHRLSTVVNADHIYVLKDGHLAEDGSFADLSERMGSLFGTMWRDYQQSVQWKVAKEA